MIDRERLFDGARPILGGSLSQGQVDGIGAMLDAWDASGYTDLRWLAYELGTAVRETASTMQPIAEYGKGEGRPYGRPDPITGQTYYGRGFVQLTWKANYAWASQITGTDLVNHPDLAMDPVRAAKIALVGMVGGHFTGKKLSDYISGPRCDWFNARRIINGLDHATEIMGHAQAFNAVLSVAPGAPLSA